MSKQIYFWFILLFSTTLFAQESLELDKKMLSQGKQIVSDAQKVIGAENIKLESFNLKIKSTYDEEILDSINELKVLLPDKICIVQNSPKPFPTITTTIWNGVKYRKFSESEYFGQRMVVDMTNPPSNSRATEIGNKIGKGKAEKLKSLKRINQREWFYNDVWWKFFGVILMQPFENNLEFKYVGKAKSGDITANIVDVKSKNNRNYRLIFDSATNYLLMMIESFKGDDGGYEVKYYYSNRERKDNVLIPKKIKIENKFIPTGKEPRISYTNIDVLDFNLNPDFKESLFEIK
jgi:hypothetical protein